MADRLSQLPEIINYAGPDSGFPILRENHVRVPLCRGMIDSGHNEHTPVGGVVIDSKPVRGDRTNLGVTVRVLCGELIKGTRKRKQVAFGGHFAAYPERTVLYLT